MASLSGRDDGCGVRGEAAAVQPGPLLREVAHGGPGDAQRDPCAGSDGLGSFGQELDQRSPDGAAIVSMNVDGRALQLEVRSADARVGVSLLGELSRFRCPEPW